MAQVPHPRASDADDGRGDRRRRPPTKMRLLPRAVRLRFILARGL